MDYTGYGKSGFRIFNTSKTNQSKSKINLHEMDWIISFAANQKLAFHLISNPTQDTQKPFTSGSQTGKKKDIAIIPDYFDYSIYPIILNLVFSENSNFQTTH